jgi:acetolactate synthase-1/2/3 large subunit
VQQNSHPEGRAPGGVSGTVSTAQVFLRALAEHGVEYFFANAGTDFAPIAEAFARGGAKLPKPVIATHEGIAVGMAHGYYALTGRPQAVMVHVNVGTANTINCLINAARDEVPIILCAGRTPVTEHGRLGSRSRFIHWAQEMFDQGGMVREVVKWDYELRVPEQAADVVARAFEVAMTQPRGPVYLQLPRETLGIELASVPATPQRALPTPPHPDPSAIAKLAQWLDEARFPVLVTSGLGRNAGAVPALARLAERAGLGVLQPHASYCSLPASHPMHLGYESVGILREADLVIVLDCDVPWLPAGDAPRADARIVSIGVDPIFAAYPMRSFRSDLTLEADPGSVIAALEVALDRTSRPPQVAERRARFAERARGSRARWQHESAAADPMTPAYVSRCIAAHVDDDAIVVNEYPLRLEHCPIEWPGTFFGVSTAGGLGWGLGAALGAKLAAPAKLVIATLGDGAYVFANPTAGHWAAQMHDLPILVVIFNNAMWGAVRKATLGMYPHGAAAQADGMMLADLSPSPAFEKIVEAHGGYGERVERAADLPRALERAVGRVRRGQQVVLNVICSF